MKISSLLHNESRWTQNCIARDKEGKSLKDINTFYLQRVDKKGNIYYQEFRNEDLAYSYSLQGSVIRCYDIDERENVMHKLSAAIEQYTGKNYYVAQFNDLSDTTFEDIKKVLKIAEV
jgi:hypothetical protein